MRIVGIVESRRWRNAVTGATASPYGAVPWTSSCDRVNWSLETTGWTWELVNGTIGLGRTPAVTRDEALQVMARHNARFER